MATDRSPSDARRLTWLGIAACIIYLIVALLSEDFAFGVPGTRHPILVTLVLFWAAFGIYLVSLRLAIRLPDRLSLPRVVFFSVLMRFILLVSHPIQEVDIYRYMWDGNVTAVGVSPYRFSPAEVRQADASADLPKNLRTLVDLRDSSAGLQNVLTRVHFPVLRTPYPPMSQLVFFVSAMTTPADASVETHLLVMKLWIVAFDIGTIALLILLLRHFGRPAGWVLAYAWCPLVIKEFANSGHLDSMAVFFTMAAVYALSRAVFPGSSTGEESRPKYGLIALAAALLACGVGAKIYPLVLSPVFGILAWKRAGVAKTVVAVGVFCATTLLVMWPMITWEESDAGNAASGLQTFARRWEINDFLFLVAIENLKPTDTLGDQPEAWFSVVPYAWRRAIIDKTAPYVSTPRQFIPHLIGRALLLAVFTGIVCWLCVRLYRDPSGERFLESAFLTLAWFWLLSPTQNPWYWVWAVPLLPFARGRAWFALSGLVLIYYLRFWFGYQSPESEVAGTGYRGLVFFDLVVSWFEYLPFFLWLAIGAIRTKNPSIRG